MPVRQLSEAIVNRIAAGEVVERPASVVKELVENALDAGARRIDVLTDGGGRRLVRVTDDGEGMTRADLALAVERHATSKLDDDDLLAIRTLGFRGEALPSIGAVARLTITTRHAGEPQRLGDHRRCRREIGGEAGRARRRARRVEVRDLFYATPARLKFLKTDRSEAEAVREVVRRLAMSRPDVAFTLAGEERAPVTWSARRGAVTRLRGSAMCSAPTSAPMPSPIDGGARRRSRSKALPACRRCRAPTRSANISSSTAGRCATSCCSAPCAPPMPITCRATAIRVLALFVTLDPREVDVNVHPAKTEVRFRDGGAGARPDRARVEGGAGARRPARGDDRRQRHHRRVPPGCRWRGAAAMTGGARRRGHPALHRCAALLRGLGRSRAGGFRCRRAGRRCARSRTSSRAADLIDRPLGAARAQLHETYIVAQTRDGLVIVDQHAAHERIVYERMKAALEKSGVARQILLIPEIVELDEADVARLVRARRRACAIRPGDRSRSAPARSRCARRRRCSARSMCRRLVRDLAEHMAEWDEALPLERRLHACRRRPWRATARCAPGAGSSRRR